jgi:hypothetical protein
MAERARKERSNEWAMMLRRAVAQDQRTMYAIAQAADIEQSQLVRFMAGKSLDLAVAEDLAKVLGYDLVPAKKIGIQKTARKLDS